MEALYRKQGFSLYIQGAGGNFNIFILIYRYVYKEYGWNISNIDFFYYLFYLYFFTGYGGKYKKRYNNYGGIEVFIRGQHHLVQ